MTTDLLSQFADIVEAKKQFDYVQTRIDEYVKSIEEASKIGLKTFSGFGDTKSLADQIEKTKVAAEATRKMSVSVDGLNSSYEKAAVVMATLNGHSKEYLTNVKIIEQAESTATLTKIRLTKEQERQSSLSDRRAAQLQREQSAYGKLNVEYKEAATLARNLSAEYMTIAGNSQLMAARGEESFAALKAEMEAAQAKALSLRNQMKVINNSVGDNTLNVGNYANTAAEISAIKEEMLQLELRTKESATQMGILNERSTQLRANLFTTAGAGGLGINSSYYNSLTLQLSEVNTQMDKIRVKTIEDQEEFERLAGRVAELKAAISGVTAAVNEAGEKMAAAGERAALAFEKVGETLKEIGRFAIAFFGVQAGMEFISGITEEFGKADENARQLKKTLENAGNVQAFSRLTEDAEKFTQKLNFLDTYEIQEVFTKLLDYGKLTETQIKDLTPVIIDFAAKEHISIAAGADVITKALEGNARGLKQYGINIKDAALETETAASPAERFSLIMKELKPRVEGAAEAFRGSFPGKIAIIKKEIREVELTIADFFVMLSRVDQGQQEAAVAAKKEADQMQALVNEYEQLSGKVNQTKEDKTRLNEITTVLSANFGQSTIKINEETGAIEVNIEATKDLIKQKLLLSNQRASELALRYNKNEEERKEATEKLTVAQKAYSDAVKQTGITEDQVNAKLFNRDSPVPFANLTEGEKKIARLADAVNKFGGNQRDAGEEANKYAKQLKELGFTVEDVNKLFDPNKEIKPRGDLSAGGKKKDTADSDISAKYQAEKDLNDAIFELSKQRYKNDADNQALIFDSEKENLRKRLEAYDNYQKDMLAIATIENAREISDLQSKQKEFQEKEAAYHSGKLKLTKMAYDALVTEDQAYGLKVTAKQEDLQNKVAAINLTGITKRMAITRSANEVWIKSEETGLQERIADFEGMYDQEKQLLDQSLKNKLIKTVEYENKLKALRFSYDTINLREQIAEYQYELKNEQLTAEEKLAIETKLNNSVKALREKNATQDLENARKVEAVTKQITDKEVEVIQEGLTIGKTALDARYQKELDYQQQVLDGIEKNKQADIDAVNNSLASQQQKQQQIAGINAQAAAKEKGVQQEMNRIKRNQAIADRAAALLNIAEQTAIAEVSTLKLLGDPITAPLVPELEIAIAALGIAQAAAIFAKPLPAYFKGTPPGGHMGGLALMGEYNLAEMVVEPGKNPYIVDSPVIKNLPVGTEVFSNEQLLAAQMGFLTPKMMSMAQGSDNGEIIQSANRNTGAIIRAINEKSETHVAFSENGFTKWVRSGSSKQTFVDKNFN